MIVVSDSSPLTALARAGYTHLLPQLFGSVIIPEGVRNELENAPPGAPEIYLSDQPWIRVVNNVQQVRSLEALLDPGQAEAIALALQIKADPAGR